MKSIKLEMIVGIFVVIGIVALGYISIKLGKKEILGNDHYSIFADFDSVSGLRQNAQIEIAGVKIGNVRRIFLTNGVARVEMQVKNDINIPDDTIVSVKTRGLIGDKVLNVSLGGSPVFVEPGGVLVETESVIDLEDLIGRFIFGKM
ncbi:MAG: outer membrane lipid asymmetry maintenance protein MlaD [Nitrospinales bacterium]